MTIESFAVQDREGIEKMDLDRKDRDEWGRFLPGSQMVRVRRGKAIVARHGQKWYEWRQLGVAYMRAQAPYRQLLKNMGLTINPRAGHYKLMPDLIRNYSLEDLEALRGRIAWRVRQGWTTAAILRHLLDGDL